MPLHYFHKRRISLYYELMIAVAILLLATYILTPRFWEPGGESWKQWAAARILNETGGFPVFSLGPVYVVYLQLFQLFDYPQLIKIEYVITHLFAYTAIFLMLRSLLPGIFALLLTSAWIPMIAILEQGGAVAGVGFVALYYWNCMRLPQRKEYFPIPLIIAALCHSAYFPFLVGNVIGILIEKCLHSKTIVASFHSIKQTQMYPLIIKIGLFMIVVLTLFFPSHRWDHNHMLADPVYAPVPFKNPLSIGFFQIGNWKYVERTIPESLWIYQDWYFTHEKAFGGATTILQAVCNRPGVVMSNILENACAAYQLPKLFISGNCSVLFTSISLVLFPIGIVGVIQHFKIKGLVQCLVSSIIGFVTICGTLLLTWYNPRYIMTLLPVGLLIVAHIGTGLKCLIKWFSEEILVKSSQSAIKNNSKKEICIFILGSLLVLIGFVSNEWFLSALFSRDAVLSFPARLQIWILNILLVGIGIFIIISVLCPYNFFTNRIKQLGQKDPSGINVVIVLISAILVLTTAYYPHGRMAQIKAVFGNRAFLSCAQPVSMAMAFPKLQITINEKTNILASEDTWIKAFTKVDLNKVHSVFSLPPFPDTSGNVEKMLDSLDVIWVSNGWAKEEPSVATQSFLRYRLHVLPFIEKALKRGWLSQDIEGYGKIYRRLNAEQKWHLNE